jgi:hypothetical protein
MAQRPVPGAGGAAYSRRTARCPDDRRAGPPGRCCSGSKSSPGVACTGFVAGCSAPCMLPRMCS